MAKILCVLYPDPKAGYPPIYARDEIPTLTRYANGQTAPTPKGPLGFKPGELVGSVSGELGLRPYVIVQKYLHDMKGWNALSVETQERIIGRKKLSDIELSDAVKPPSAHNALTTIVENGKEIKILRDNMPFGRPGHGEFGTYFIGYSRSPRTTEQMLENMFIGRPPGNYDRLLDFSRAITGNLFFAPSATFLENLDEEPTSVSDSPPPPEQSSAPATHDTSLHIGSLKGEPHE